MVQDFDVQEGDRLNFAGTSIDSFGDLLNEHAFQMGADIGILGNLDSGGAFLMTIKNTDLDTLRAGDCIF